MTRQKLTTVPDGPMSSDGPRHSTYGYPSDKDSGGMFYVLRLA